MKNATQSNEPKPLEEVIASAIRQTARLREEAARAGRLLGQLLEEEAGEIEAMAVKASIRPIRKESEAAQAARTGYYLASLKAVQAERERVEAAKEILRGWKKDGAFAKYQSEGHLFRTVQNYQEAGEVWEKAGALEAASLIRELAQATEILYRQGTEEETREILGLWRGEEAGRGKVQKAFQGTPQRAGEGESGSEISNQTGAKKAGENLR